MCAPGIGGLATDFNISSHHVSTLAITIYVLGLAIGPMFIAPISEVYGRLFVYHTASLTFVAFLVGNALSKNISQFMAFRFLAGCAGGTPMALGGGTIADITTLEKRGVAMALFSLGPLTGPVSLMPSPILRVTFMLTRVHDLGARPCHWGIHRGQDGVALDLLDINNVGRDLRRHCSRHYARNTSQRPAST